MEMKNKNGFTLIEVLIVIGVIGLLAGIAATSLLSWLPNMRLKAVARDLYSNMQHARVSAVKTNAVSAVVFDKQNSRYYLCDDWGADGSWSGENDDTGTGDNNIVMTFDLDSSNGAIRYGHATISGRNSATKPAVSIPEDNISYLNNILTFNARGISNAGYVYLQNQNNTVYAVGTQASGVVKLVRWNGGGWQ